MTIRENIKKELAAQKTILTARDINWLIGRSDTRAQTNYVRKICESMVGQGVLYSNRTTGTNNRRAKGFCLREY